MDKANGISLVLSNDAGEEVVIGYDKTANQFFIDRTKSGKVDFHKDFAARHVASRLARTGKMDMTGRCFPYRRFSSTGVSLNEQPLRNHETIIYYSFHVPS
ncbi:MAG: GH32 C-terminal domain-containing protein [Flavisolibacter sp.]|nr:GH32 C-terminal domain-containing protein [Flavisolibacter sp.]MBD0298057.1 GH32 C-terminal domain-containing protein [Flavisolibacter sp.]MBD0350298.1 GH32 C-terminal domain-containing protein [Flavisolibacter sp.]